MPTRVVVTISDEWQPEFRRRAGREGGIASELPTQLQHVTSGHLGPQPPASPGLSAGPMFSLLEVAPLAPVTPLVANQSTTQQNQPHSNNPGSFRSSPQRIPGGSSAFQSPLAAVTPGGLKPFQESTSSSAVGHSSGGAFLGGSYASLSIGNGAAAIVAPSAGNSVQSTSLHHAAAGEQQGIHPQAQQFAGLQALPLVGTEQLFPVVMVHHSHLAGGPSAMAGAADDGCGMMGLAGSSHSTSLAPAAGVLAGNGGVSGGTSPSTASMQLHSAGNGRSSASHIGNHHNYIYSCSAMPPPLPFQPGVGLRSDVSSPSNLNASLSACSEEGNNNGCEGAAAAGHQQQGTINSPAASLAAQRASSIRWEAMSAPTAVHRLRSLRRDRDVSRAVHGLAEEQRREMLGCLTADPSLVMELCTEQRGIIVCDVFEALGGEACSALFGILRVNFTALATSQRGSLAITRIFEAATLPQRALLCDAAMTAFPTLACDRFANFVVRRMITDSLTPPCVHSAMASLFTQIQTLIALTGDKHASHVLEAYVSTPAGVVNVDRFMWHALMSESDSVAVHLAAHAYANYVLQGWLGATNALGAEARLALFQRLRPLVSSAVCWGKICKVLFGLPHASSVTSAVLNAATE